MASAWLASGSGSEKTGAAAVPVSNSVVGDAVAGSSSMDPNDDENQCNICLGEEGAPDIYFIPCGHKACDACVKKIRHSNIYKADKGVRCPFCRQVIESYTDQPPPCQQRSSSSGASVACTGSGTGKEIVRKPYGRSGVVSIGDGNDYAAPKNITGEAGTALRPGSRDSEWPQGYKFPTLRDVDDVVTMAFDRMGARHLDWMLRETFPKKYRVAKTCFEHLMSHAAKLAAHATGNYVIQRMMDFAANHRGCHTEGDIISGAYTRMVKSLAKERGLVALAQDQHGRFTAQRLIVSIKGEEELRLVMESIQANMLKLAVDPFGVSLLERIVEVIIPSLNPPNPSMKPRVPAAAATKAAVQFCKELGSDDVPSVTLVKLGRHPLASILLVETIRWSLPREEGFTAARNVSNLSAELAGSKGGNRLLQGILSLDVMEIAETLIMCLKGRYAGLVLDYHGGGCKVVRACLGTPSVDDYCRLEIVDEMLQMRSLSAILEQPHAVDVLAFGLATLSGRMLSERLGFLRAYPQSYREVRDLVEKFRQQIQAQGPLQSSARYHSANHPCDSNCSVSGSPPPSSAAFPPLAPLPSLVQHHAHPPPPPPPPPPRYLNPDTGCPNPLGPSNIPPGSLSLFPPLSNSGPGTGPFSRTAAVSSSAASSGSVQGSASLPMSMLAGSNLRGSNSSPDSLNMSAMTQSLAQFLKPPDESQKLGPGNGTTGGTGTRMAERWVTRSSSSQQDSGQGTTAASAGSSTYLPPHLRGSSPVGAATTPRVAAEPGPNEKMEKEEGLVMDDHADCSNRASYGDDMTGKDMWTGQTMESHSKNDADGKGRQQSLCVVCNLKHINTVLMGCAHWCACMTCASKLSSCPMCGAPITGMLQVQIALDKDTPAQTNSGKPATEGMSQIASGPFPSPVLEKAQVGIIATTTNGAGSGMQQILEAAPSAEGLMTTINTSGGIMSSSSSMPSVYISAGCSSIISLEEITPPTTAEPLPGSLLTDLLQPQESSIPAGTGMGVLTGMIGKPPTVPPSSTIPFTKPLGGPIVAAADQMSWMPTGMNASSVNGSGIPAVTESVIGASTPMSTFSAMSSTEQALGPPPPSQYPTHPSHSPFPWHQCQSTSVQALPTQHQPLDSTYRTFTGQTPYANSSMYTPYSSLPPPRIGGPMMYLQTPGHLPSQSSATGIPLLSPIAQTMMPAFRGPPLPSTMPSSIPPSNNNIMVLPYSTSAEGNAVSMLGTAPGGGTLAQPAAAHPTASVSSQSTGGVVHQNQGSLSTAGAEHQSQSLVSSGGVAPQSQSLTSTTLNNGSEQGAVRTSFRLPGGSLPKPAPYRPPAVYRPPM